ncbi:MAG: IclR family transcriptional regulator [Lachnospiraceae bacterium]|nr:IclR family transcriptional regulator [Lachnospiraceae bacterium]
MAQGITIQSVARAFQILECFTGSVSEIGITDISRQMGLGKSTVYGLVNTLVQEGYLEQNPENKCYRLGLKLFEMGCIVQERMDIREIAKPYLKELSSSFKMTVHMGLYKDYEVVYIDKVDAPDTRIVYSQVGKRAPMYCTGIGKAVLAELEQREIDFLLDGQEREQLTPHTLTGKEDIIRELGEIRRRGYAIDNEEVELGLKCVASAIYDYQGKPAAAISISSSAVRMDEERMEEISRKLKRAAGEISRKLGYRQC